MVVYSPRVFIIFSSLFFNFMLRNYYMFFLTQTSSPIPCRRECVTFYLRCCQTRTVYILVIKCQLHCVIIYHYVFLSHSRQHLLYEVQHRKEKIDPIRENKDLLISCIPRSQDIFSFCWVWYVCSVTTVQGSRDPGGRGCGPSTRSKRVWLLWDLILFYVLFISLLITCHTLNTKITM